ncbi:MAG: hypothetical protein AB7P20_27155, partial [Rhizobiaceae bacterium]
GVLKMNRTVTVEKLPITKRQGRTCRRMRRSFKDYHLGPAFAIRPSENSVRETHGDEQHAWHRKTTTFLVS